MKNCMHYSKPSVGPYALKGIATRDTGYTSTVYRPSGMYAKSHSKVPLYLCLIFKPGGK